MLIVKAELVAGLARRDRRARAQLRRFWFIVALTVVAEVPTIGRALLAPQLFDRLDLGVLVACVALQVTSLFGIRQTRAYRRALAGLRDVL